MSQESDPDQNIDYRRTINVARVHNATARENPDFIAESRPVSLWIFIAGFAVTLIGGGYYGANAAATYNKFGINYQPVPPEGPAGATVEVDDMTAGGKVFSTNCASCHQLNGGGIPGQYPPLDGSEWVNGSDERLGTILVWGLSGPITVKGQPYSGAIQMPAWAALGDKKVAQVMTYVRGSWSNKSEPVAVEGIKDLKVRNPGRQAGCTSAELEKIDIKKMLPKPAPAGPPPAPGATPAGATPAGATPAGATPAGATPPAAATPPAPAVK